MAQNAAAKEDRGSQKMLEQLFGKSAKPSADDIKAALGAHQENYEVQWWWWRGTPPAWIELYARLTVEREQAGELVQRLINNRSMELSVEVSAIGARANRLTLDVSNVPKEAR